MVVKERRRFYQGDICEREGEVNGEGDREGDGGGEQSL
jgi:hypothetical protein